jgi:anti-sigma B factor antagonist/stage II sporulation protein AA (anti-sigma F factor antagonist)
MSLAGLGSVVSEDADGSVLISLEGEIDLRSASTVERCVRGALDVGCTKVVIDLAGVSFIDSSGLNTLVRCHHTAGEAGVPLELRGVTEYVRRAFEVTRLNRFFVLT